jgi:hypothetical protein
MEDECIYVSSRGLLKSCDVKSSTPQSDAGNLINYNIQDFQEYSTIYITTSCMKTFSFMLQNLDSYQFLNKKFILVSGDSDLTVPYDIFSSYEEFLQFINNDNIIHWYSQNCIISHPKVSNLPIGLDFHSIGNEEYSISPQGKEIEMRFLQKKARPFWERNPICYSTFHFATYETFVNVRKRAINDIPTECVFYEPERIKRYETWKNQTEYAFVSSPHGHGLDCHRTWEALCLGCIPVVVKSGLDPLYEGLPVLILDSYKDLSLELLQKTIIEFKDRKWNMEKLTLEYWFKKINSHKK